LNEIEKCQKQIQVMCLGFGRGKGKLIQKVAVQEKSAHWKDFSLVVDKESEDY